MRITFRAPLIAVILFVVAPLATSLLVSRAPSARAAASPRTRTQPVRALRSRSVGLQPTGVERRKFLRRILPKLGSQVAFRKVARSLGITHWRGKAIVAIDGPSVKPDVARMSLDQPVDSFDGSQNQPSIAVDPTDDSTVVIFAQNESNFTGLVVACSIYVSFDGGVTFAYADDAPVLLPTDTCADPVVRYAPDGSVVYFSYLSIRDDSSSSDVVVTVGDGDDPVTIVSGPTNVMPGGTDFMDKPWLGVHTFDSADGSADGGGYVYVTGTIFISNNTCSLLINRSADSGATWDFGGGMAIGGAPSDCDVAFLHGARVAGGPGAQVLVCFYNSEADGFSPTVAPPALSNRFDITCVSSVDRWSSQSGLITAANNVGYELNEFLGPNETYHRWWPGMFPDVEIDHRGNAHVTFAMDPTANKVDAESGNVRYTRSLGGALGPPYPSFTGGVTLGTGPRAQGFPNVVAQRSNLTTNAYIYVSYYDHYRSTLAAPNRLYDVRYRRSTNGGGTFAAPVTVTDVVSLSDRDFIGDNFDTTASMRKVHWAWTDRGDKTDILDPEDDIFSDRR
jgi:hypothetical protein